MSNDTNTKIEENLWEDFLDKQEEPLDLEEMFEYLMRTTK